MNKNKKRIIGSLVALCLFTASFAQEEYFMTGLPLDDGTYDQLERKVEFVTKGTNVVLPKQHSLLQYCPTAKSQGGHGTCTSWACLYAARTIAEAKRQGWTSQKTIEEEAFSPLFTYSQLKNKEDFNCDKGIHIFDALRLMKEQGCVKFSDFDDLCADASAITQTLKSKASKYKIDDYKTLFSIGCHDAMEKETMVKKSLVEGRPVVIAMWLPPMFSKTEEVMKLGNIVPNFPVKNTKITDYHAMCVVGYDDNKAGGSFQLMNSWGKNWGKNGFVWVKYADFAKCVDQAYEIIVKPLPKPEPKPEPNKLSGSFEILLTHDALKRTNPNATLKVGLDEDNRYAIQKTFYENDQFRIYVSNGEAANVYIISSDMTKNDALLFPYKNISSRLDKSYAIALPSKAESITMDSTKGTDYWCVLYSVEELGIQGIMQRMKTAQGSFYDRVQAALGDKMVPQKDIRFVENKVEFSARSEKSVVAVFIEAKHR